MSEKLQKVLARAGFGSRREIERWISEGRIKLKGKVATLGDRMELDDRIEVDGKRIHPGKLKDKRTRVLVYHKPAGKVCTRNDPEKRPTIFEDLPPLAGGRWISVGRLDINSSGLLLFTNYGELANKLMHPSSEIEREYAVRVNGEVTDDIVKRLLKGVELEDGFLKFDSITDSGGQGANHWYNVILKEGKNREVRRLWQSQDVRVSRLIRVRYGNLSLPRTLKLGRKVELSLDEIKALFAFVKLEWPSSRDEESRERSKKAKNLSIKQQLYGSNPQAKTSRSRTGQKHKAGLRKKPKSVQSKVKKKR